MTLATEKVKTSSERFSLVRVNPGVELNASLFNVSGSVPGLFTATNFSNPVTSVAYSFTKTINAIYRGGVLLTKVSDTPNSDGEWNQDSDGIITLYLSSSPGLTSSLPIVAYYYLYYTSGQDRIFNETPTDTSSEERHWEGKLVADPQTTESFSNISHGLITTSATAIRILDQDLEFLDYLLTGSGTLSSPKALGSFFKKDVEIWYVVNRVVTKIFTGKVVDVSRRRDEISLGIYDATVDLNTPAYMGDNIDEATLTTTGFPSLPRSEDLNKPVPYCFSRSRVSQAFHEFGTSGDTPVARTLDYRGSHVASPISTNVTWTLARSSGFKTLNFGSISSASLLSTGTNGYNYNGDTRANLRIVTTGSNLELNDSFKWTHASVSAGANQYAVVMSISGTTIDCMVLSQNSTGTVNVTSGTFTTNSAPGLILYNAKSGNTYVPCFELDFTISSTATSGGNFRRDITFVSGFATATLASLGGGRVHPGTDFIGVSIDDDVVAFRITEDGLDTTSSSKDRHGVALEKILESIGYTVDAASFSSANTQTAARVSFTIPNYDEDTYDTYGRYVTDLLNSTLGYIYQDSSAVFFYKLLAKPTPTQTIDDSIYLRGSLTWSTEYQDIGTTFQARNNHYLINLSQSQAKETYLPSVYLHAPGASDEFAHVLQDVTVTRAIGGLTLLKQVAYFRGERTLTFRFEVSSEAIDYLLGDDITLESETVPSGFGTIALKIISISRGVDSIGIEATDLLGVAAVT